MRVHFLTHPEVDIAPEVPVTEWGLNDRGRQRARLAGSKLPALSAIYSSPEVKAEQTARLIGEPLGLTVTLVGGLAEVDRAATGYLPEPEFWANYQQFLDRPSYSARGWETAESAQRRIVATVDSLLAAADGEIALVSHGGVGALLLCHLNGTPIQRLVDQPGQGSHFSFDAASRAILEGWRSFEDLA
ncbi:histidine phosphatase family protein [Jatrophihabitans sp. DSM 45814]